MWCGQPSYASFTAQKMKFSMRDFFSKCGQIRIFKVNNKDTRTTRLASFWCV